MNAVNKGLADAARGPVIMITIGVLFLLDRFTGFGFGQTWPLILIVLGGLALAGGGGWSCNNKRSAMPPPPPVSPGVPPPPPPGVRR